MSCTKETEATSTDWAHANPPASVTGLARRMAIAVRRMNSRLMLARGLVDYARVGPTLELSCEAPSRSAGFVSFNSLFCGLVLKSPPPTTASALVLAFADHPSHDLSLQPPLAWPLLAFR